MLIHVHVFFSFLFTSLVKDFSWYIGTKQWTKAERQRRALKRNVRLNNTIILIKSYSLDLTLHWSYSGTCDQFLRGKRETLHSSLYCTIKLVTSEYMKDRVFVLWRKKWRHDWSSSLYTHNLSSCEINAWKKTAWTLNPGPLRYRYSALPTELSNHLWAGRFVSS